MDDKTLDYRFLCGVRMYNILVKHCRKQLARLQEDKMYQELLVKRMESGLTKAEKNCLNKQLSGIRMDYGLSQYQMYGYVKLQQHRYKKHIDSRTAQAVAKEVWRSVEKYLFDDGKAVHFKRYDGMYSMESNSNDTGIRYKNGRMLWNGLDISVQIQKKKIPTSWKR